MLIAKIFYVSRSVRVILLCYLSLSFSLVGMEEAHHTKIIAVGGLSLGDTVVTGRACVVTGRKQLNKICQGDIVVAVSTNSSWDTALKRSAAIITEEGGSSSHAALLGKKLGIPVIVGATGVTKKIIDESLISFDCAQRTVCELAQDSAVFGDALYNAQPFCVDGYQSVHYGFPSFCGELMDGCVEQLDHDHVSSATHAPKEKSIFTKNAHKRHHNFIDITKERVCNDIANIKRYVTIAVKKDIDRAVYWTKKWATYAVTAYAYDSIPLEFFKNNEAIEEVFNRLEDGSDYIQEKKETFKNEIMGNTTKIDNSKIAEFLYKNVVDHIDVTDEQRKILHEEPIQMDEFVRNKKVKRSEYMYYTLLNFTVRYYLEEELKKT